MKLLGNDKQQNNENKEVAHELKNAFSAVSHFIEKHTSIVCPECEKVCCIDKHGRYDKNDIVFLRALSIEIYNDISGWEETDLCRFLNEEGCSRHRWERPFRCTHFFCDPLLNSLENDNAKLYRKFIGNLQHLVGLRSRLLDIS